MLIEKKKSLSTKPKPVAERISYTAPCQMLVAQMCGRSFEVLTAPKIPTCPVKLCPIMTAQLSIPSPRLSWFLQGRSCEDQILQIFQAIEDGFQQRPMQSSVLTLPDFSKIYDIIWREKLLLCMPDAGVPMTFIRWLHSFNHSFLTTCKARVQLHNVCSSSRCFNQGLSQGSILVPLLFLFYINNLAENLLNDAAVALFADDVSIQTTAR